ncbi:monocarboxylate transporter 12-like [Glandiceps talaboti]
MGIAFAGAGFGQFIIAVGSQVLIEQFGWRGALMIISSVTSNICVAAALFRPLERKTRNESPANRKHQRDTFEMTVVENNVCERNNDRQQTRTVSEQGNQTFLSRRKNMVKTSVIQNGGQTDKNKSGCCSSCACLKKTLSTFYDVALFKEPVFILTIILIILHSMGSNVFNFHTVKRALEFGILPLNAGFLPAVLGLGQIAGRLLFGGIANIPKIKPYVLYSACFAGCAIVVAISIYWRTFTGQIITMSMYGILNGGSIVLIPLNIACFFGPAKIGHGFSILSQFIAVTALAVGPLSGWMRDVYGTYDQVFWFSAGSFIIASLLCMLLPVVDAIVKKRRRRNSSEPVTTQPWVHLGDDDDESTELLVQIMSTV